jgi:multiple sugar transport system substrate-binding protein
MKKILLTAVAALCLAAFAALALHGFAKTKPRVTLTFKMPTLATRCINDPSVREAYDIFTKATADFAAQYKDADVTFRLVKFDLADESKYIPGCFDKSDAADILYEDFFNMSTYIYTGRVVPLDDVIGAGLRRDIDDSYWKMGSARGRTYMLPFLARQNVLGYHRSMLRKAGLSKFVSDGEDIQSWTLDEWNEVLSTLAKRLPAGCYALAMYAANEQSDTHIMTYIRSHGSQFFDKNGRFDLETPQAVAALKWIKSNYDKGVYPPNCENLVARDCGNLFWNNQLAIKMINGPGADAEDTDIGLVNFPGADGKGLATAFVTGFEVFDNGDPARVKAAKDFLRFFYGSEKYMDYSAGNMPVSARVTGKYKDRIYRLASFKKNEDLVVDFMHNNPNWRGVRAIFYKHIQELLTGAKTPQQTAAALDRDCNAAIEQGRREGKLHQ